MHTLKFGGEYRQIESKFRFLGSEEITYAGINEFIDNRPTQVAVALDSPFFTPQQFYAIGFAQDSWRVGRRLTLELGLRYDFYSVVKEKDSRARPFFIEENDFGSDPDNFYNADKNNFAPRLSAAYQLTDRTVIRAGTAFSTVQGSSKIAFSRLRTSSKGGGSSRPTFPSWPTRWIRPRIEICSPFAAIPTNGPTSTTSSTV